MQLWTVSKGKIYLEESPFVVYNNSVVNQLNMIGDQIQFAMAGKNFPNDKTI